MEYILKTTLCPAHGGATWCDEIGLPVEESSMCLPCGSTAVWCQDEAGDAFYA